MTVYDLDLYVGGDLGTTATGDLTTASATERTKQRILRRLMTNPGDYIWHPGYGAGLPAKIGEVFNEPELRALILGQVLMESAVARNPAPTVAVQQIAGGVAVSIHYTDAPTQTPQSLFFDVSQ